MGAGAVCGQYVIRGAGTKSCWGKASRGAKQRAGALGTSLRLAAESEPTCRREIRGDKGGSSDLRADEARCREDEGRLGVIAPPTGAACASPQTGLRAPRRRAAARRAGPGHGDHQLMRRLAWSCRRVGQQRNGHGAGRACVVERMEGRGTGGEQRDRRWEETGKKW